MHHKVYEFYIDLFQTQLKTYAYQKKLLGG